MGLTFDNFKNWMVKVHQDPLCFGGHVFWFLLSGYGLWVHSLLFVLIGLGLSFLFCLPACCGYDARKLVSKLVESRLSFFGMMFYIGGLVLLSYGLWNHNKIFILVGLILSFLIGINGCRKKSD